MSENHATPPAPRRICIQCGTLIDDDEAHYPHSEYCPRFGMQGKSSIESCDCDYGPYCQDCCPECQFGSCK